MPAAFTDTEKQRIRAALITAGFKRFQRQGLKSTTVDDLARDVGISKGAFYAFYRNKEALFADIAVSREDEAWAMITNVLDNPGDDPAARLYDASVEMVENDPMVRMVTEAGAVEQFVRRLPPDVVAEGYARKEARLVEFAARWNDLEVGPPVTTDELKALFTFIIITFIHHLELQPEDYEATRAMLRDLFILRLTKGRP